MVRLLRIAAVVLGIPMACVPLAFLLTVLCAPFWEWFEAATAIQSYGHHGPLEWCYLATFVALVAAGYALAFTGWRRRKPRPATSSRSAPQRGAA